MLLLDHEEAARLVELGKVRGRAEMIHEIIGIMKRGEWLTLEDDLLAYIEGELKRMTPDREVQG